MANLETKLILVLGHESCGAVTAAVKGGDQGYNLNTLLDQIKPVINASNISDSVDEIAKKNAEAACQNLIDNSIIISNATSTGLEIKPAFYRIESGKVTWL